MKNIIEAAINLIKATQSAGLDWEYMEDAPCLSTTYNGLSYIMCKSETDFGYNMLSLNYLDANGFLLTEFNKWKDDEDEYKIIDELYTLAQKHPVLKVC